MDIEIELSKLAHLSKAKILQGFFKTGKGQYGEGDVFWGITVPQCRSVAKCFPNLSFAEIQQLLNSKVHEKRLVALLILVQRYQAAEKKEDSELQEKVFQFYIKNLPRVNNWDLVDLTASNIVGKHLFGKDNAMLYRLAKSKNLWARRVAIVSTFAFIRNGQFQPTLKIVELLLGDTHDLIHKACGWMLREVGKKDQAAEEAFLEKHYANMPRTMLRYAIERFSEEKRRHYLHKSIRLSNCQ